MKTVNETHQTEYGVLPEIVVKAPGRIHLIGDHSWFFKDKTLSMAISLPVYVSISKRNDSVLKFYFHQLNERKRANIGSIKLKKEDRWANAIKSVIYGYISAGFSLGGMDICVYSEILPSAGFGITTAVKAATALAVKELFAVPFTDSQLLQVLERGNRRFLQQNNYLADNFTALFSKKNNFIITDYSKNTWDYVPFNFSNKKIFLVDTKVPRVSLWNEDVIHSARAALFMGDLKEFKPNAYGGWQYINNITDINEVLEELSDFEHLSEVDRRRLVCIIKEHEYLLNAVEGLYKDDFFKFSRAVNLSHEGMRDMYEISCPEIDWILKRVNELEPNLEMITKSVSCGRITGKGFGRCLYAIIRSSDEEKFKAKLTEFEKIFGYHADCYEVTPAEGAVVLRD